MAIVLRADTGSALSHNQVDTNFTSFFYSASLSGGTITLFRTGSTALGIARASSSYSLVSDGFWTGSVSNISRLGTVLVSGSFIQGSGNTTLGIFAHAQGSGTQAGGNYSHAEGHQTQATGLYSHAEGSGTQALETGSHAEGTGTQAKGIYSHAEGNNTQAIGEASHAEGFWTVASGSYQHVQGQYNLSSSIQSAFIIGNGVSDGSRSNLVFAAGNTVQITGSLRVSGSITGSLFGTASFASTASLSTVPFATTGSSIYTSFPGGSTLVGSQSIVAIGDNAGGLTLNASNANFLGKYAGYQATSGSNSNMFGFYAGHQAIRASDSNFFGNSAGVTAANASNSNFFGNGAGQYATSASNANFFGYLAGQSATTASNANFFGANTGTNATNASNSNFFGTTAGRNAKNASGSNFIGYAAGEYAASASYSTLIGHKAGASIGGLEGNSIGSNNIVIGTNITLAPQQKDSINLGGIIFATGSYSTTTGNPFSDSVSNARVGIGTSTPTKTLHVAGTTLLSGSFNTADLGSILTVVGSGSAQPVFTVQGSQGELFSVTDSLSGSLFSVNDISGLPIIEVLSDGTTLIGNYSDPMLVTTAKNVLTSAGSFTVYSLPTASYDTAFFDYSVRSGSNARAGQIMAIQSGSSVNFTEVTSSAFGSTTGISLGVFVSGSNMVLTGSAATSAWTVKTIIRSI